MTVEGVLLCLWACCLCAVESGLQMQGRVCCLDVVLQACSLGIEEAYKWHRGGFVWI